MLPLFIDQTFYIRCLLLALQSFSFWSCKKRNQTCHILYNVLGKVLVFVLEVSVVEDVSSDVMEE